MRALVVDDSTAVRLYLHKILAPCGFEVVEAKNGREGLERIREQPVDLVLLDWNMPVMNGLELLQHIRSEPSDSDATKRALTSLDAQEAATISKNYRRNVGAADSQGQGQMVMIGQNHAGSVEAYTPPPSVPGGQ